MKKYYSLFLMMGLLLLNGCQKIEELTTFNIRQETDITIPGQNTGLGELINLSKVEVASSSEQSFENNNTKAELVKEVALDELVLTITAPEEENFDFLNEISIYIKAEGVEQVLLASKKNIAENGSRVLELETTGANLRPYLLKDSYSLRTEVKTDKVIDQDVDIKISMVFRVQANVL